MLVCMQLHASPSRRLYTSTLSVAKNMTSCWGRGTTPPRTHVRYLDKIITSQDLSVGGSKRNNRAASFGQLPDCVLPPLLSSLSLPPSLFCPSTSFFQLPLIPPPFSYQLAPSIRDHPTDLIALYRGITSIITYEIRKTNDIVYHHTGQSSVSKVGQPIKWPARPYSGSKV